jgi:hypothetical protein
MGTAVLLAAQTRRQVLTLRAHWYSPFWEDIHDNWSSVFRPECTLRDAINELLDTAEDLIMRVARGDCTTEALHFLIECYNDLIAAYHLHDAAPDRWRSDLSALVTNLDRTTTIDEATAILRSTFPNCDDNWRTNPKTGRHDHWSQTESRISHNRICAWKLLILKKFGAGDRIRTGDVQLGKLLCERK